MILRAVTPILPQARQQSVPDAFRILHIPGELPSEKSLFQLEPHHDQRDGYDSVERREVRLEPQAQPNENERVRRVEGMTDETVGARARHGMITIALHSERRRRKGV